jgi:OPA family glycerol-3-phosphate transporter-like MFS transporter 3
MAKQANRRPGISFWNAWLLPGYFIGRVIVYACTYACVKLLAYSLLLWLPFYLSQVYGLESEIVGSLASTLEGGAIIGALSIGYATDKLTVRSPIIVPTLALSIPLLVFIKLIPASQYWLLYIVVFFLGMSIVGCNYMISSAIAADLATNSEVQAMKRLSPLSLGSLTAVEELELLLGSSR